MPDIVLDWLGVFSSPKKTQNSNGDDADDADVDDADHCDDAGYV